jgi:hypothetical protein
VISLPREDSSAVFDYNSEAKKGYSVLRQRDLDNNSFESQGGIREVGNSRGLKSI